MRWCGIGPECGKIFRVSRHVVSPPSCLGMTRVPPENYVAVSFMCVAINSPDATDSRRALRRTRRKTTQPTNCVQNIPEPTQSLMLPKSELKTEKK